MTANRPVGKFDRLESLTSHDQPFVTPESLADYFGVSRRHIRKEIEAGKLGAVRFGPRSIRVPIDEAINFERRCSQHSASDYSSSRERESVRSSERSGAPRDTAPPQSSTEPERR